jgi:murein DD-endopeptidase MepM/ murein hydrolase activator NlpD
MKRATAAAFATLALVAGTARAQPPIGFTVSSSAQPAARIALPSASTPNAPGRVSVPVSFTTPPAQAEHLSVAELRPLWQQAGAAYGIPWQVLAAINKIESNFGQNMGPSSAGAIGWMQFMPSTWLRWGTDADGNGIADPWTAADAIYSAARYLAAAGGQTDVQRAVFAYNHADWYVNEVLDLARVYGQPAPATVYGQPGPAPTADVQQLEELERLQAALEAARKRVVAANEGALAAATTVSRLRTHALKLRARADAITLLSDRLSAQKRAVLFEERVREAIIRADRTRAALAHAQDKLRTARQKASAPSFAAGVGRLMGAPAYSGGYVFPVGGGPKVVSVAHTHHDYPAADIAAPAGTPLYALADGVVVSAWAGIDARCGIGFTMRAFDGQVWTYCHLAYREPSVAEGATVRAGAPVGLVGSTGHATGPHLHLQLQPATEYPQNEAWFNSFAGTAFRWQDAPTPVRTLEALAPAPTRTFVAAETADSIITFTR